MITKKELTDRFSTIEINSNEIELMTSHTVYEKNEDKKDVLYPDYSGSTTHGYLGTVTFDKKNKKCYHSYLSIIDGKNVMTEVGDMQELFKAIEGFVAHVKEFHVNTDYAQPLMVEACRLESVAHQYLRHLGFKHVSYNGLSVNEYGYGGIEDKNGTLDAKSCIVRISCIYDYNKQLLPIVMHNNDGTYSNVDCYSMLEVLKNLHLLIYSKMILSNEKCFMFLNNTKESNQYILGKVDNEIKSFDFSDFFNPKISDYKQKMIENLETLLKQLKGE